MLSSCKAPGRNKPAGAAGGAQPAIKVKALCVEVEAVHLIVILCASSKQTLPGVVKYPQLFAGLVAWRSSSSEGWWSTPRSCTTQAAKVKAHHRNVMGFLTSTLESLTHCFLENIAI